MDLRPELTRLPMLQRCLTLSRQPSVDIGQIREAIGQGGFCPTHLDELMQPDPSHPYGRRVLIQSEVLESMLATWTPGAHCAPHDHGGSRGVVRVLRGVADHRIYKVVDGELVTVLTERVTAGNSLTAGPDLIHSMGDGGGEQPLVTLHLYTDPIDHMVVYDVERERTLVVDGGCGAWLPYDEPHLLRRQTEGFRTWSELGLRQPVSACPQAS